MPPVMSKEAASGNGLFSARMEVVCVLGILLVTATGTTAPFSAISGAVITMSLLSIRLAAPMFFSAPATSFDSNAGLFQFAAQTRVLPSNPAAVPMTSVPSPPAIFKNVLRTGFMDTPCRGGNLRRRNCGGSSGLQYYVTLMDGDANGVGVRCPDRDERAQPVVQKHGTVVAAAARAAGTPPGVLRD